MTNPFDQGVGLSAATNWVSSNLVSTNESPLTLPGFQLRSRVFPATCIPQYHLENVHHLRYLLLCNDFPHLLHVP